jgi:hypothetical protein
MNPWWLSTWVSRLKTVIHKKNVKEPILIHNYSTNFFDRIQQPPIKPAGPYSIFNETNNLFILILHAKKTYIKAAYSHCKSLLKYFMLYFVVCLYGLNTQHLELLWQLLLYTNSMTRWYGLLNKWLIFIPY